MGGRNRRNGRRDDDDGVNGGKGVGKTSRAERAGVILNSKPCWSHSTRTLWALGPSAVVSLGAGGQAMVPIALIGGGTVYVMDLCRAPEGALFTAWATLAFACAAAITGWSGRGGVAGFASSFVMLGMHCACLGLLGAWTTLQFRWVHRSHGSAAVKCEKFIFAWCPVVCGAILTWALSSATGGESAAFHGCFVCVVMHRLFLFPVHSGCRIIDAKLVERSAKNAARLMILSAEEASAGTVMTLVLPLVIYFGTYMGSLFDTIEHAFSLAVLSAVPALYVIMSGVERSLWWLKDGDVERTKAVEISILIVAMIGLSIGLEGAIMHGELSEYINVPAPLSYIMVIVSVTSGIASFMAHYSGLIGDAIPVEAIQFILSLSTATGFGAVGAPIWMLPIPVIGSGAFVKYYVSESETAYGTFAAMTMLSFAWFLYKHFWLLDISVGGLPIGHVCSAVLMLSAVAVALPALAKHAKQKEALSSVITAYVALLAIMEQILTEAVNDGDATIYPPYLVIVTSLGGILLARSLMLSGRMSRKLGWVLKSVCISKVSMLFVHGFREMLSVFLVTIVILAPHGISTRLMRMSAGHCINYCLALVLSLLVARFAMFDIIFELTGHRPSDATLFGGLLLMTGGSLAPVVTRDFGDDPVGKRLLVLLLSMGVFLVTFRPPLPWKGELGIWYDADHIPDSEEDEARMYGARESVHHGWPSWLLMLAVVTALFALSSSKQQSESMVTFRIGASAVCGASVGLYMALEYFAAGAGLVVTLVTACALAGIFMSFTYVPSMTSSTWLPRVYGAFLVVLAAAYVTQTGGAPETIDEEEERLEGKLGVVSVFAGTSLQIAFALKFRLQSSLQGVRQRQNRGKSPFKPAISRTRREFSRRTASRNVQRELRARSISWMPVIGNVATLTSFMACLVLSDEFTDGSLFSVFVLAPILLLLHQDAVVFPILEDSQRYAPPLAVIVGKLCYDGVCAILAGPNRVHVLTSSASKWPWMILNTLSLVLASINSINLVHYLATNERTSGMTLVLTAPLSAVPAVVSKIPAVRLLAATSLISVISQHAIQRSAKIAGLKYL